MNNHIELEAEASWEQYVEHFHKLFSDSGEGKCLLWVDPARVDPLGELCAGKMVPVLINHPRFDTNSAPYLVELDLSRSSDADLFRISVEISWNSWSIDELTARKGQYICGWVQAPDGAKALAHHWATRCHLHRKNGASYLLRFQDPGIREWLWSLLDQHQKEILLGPASRLFSVSRNRHVITHEVPSAILKRETSKISALMLDSSQFVQLEDYQVAHSAWLELMSDHEHAFDAPIGWERNLFRSLTRATEIGILHELDRTLFAKHVLQMGSAFIGWDRMKSVWRKTCLGEPYGRAVEEVFSITPDRLHTVFATPT